MPSHYQNKCWLTNSHIMNKIVKILLLSHWQHQHLVIISSVNSLAPSWCQAITWTNADSLITWDLPCLFSLQSIIGSSKTGSAAGLEMRAELIIHVDLLWKTSVYWHYANIIMWVIGTRIWCQPFCLYCIHGWDWNWKHRNCKRHSVHVLTSCIVAKFCDSI